LRIGLYLPDDKKELYEEAKKRLEKEGRSMSQLFLEALEHYLKTAPPIDVERKVLEFIRYVMGKAGLDLIVEENFKLGKLRPDAAILDSFSGDPIAVIEVKKLERRIPMADLDFIDEELEYAHAEIARKYLPLLIKQAIPYLLIAYVDKTGKLLRIDLLDITTFDKFSVRLRPKEPDLSSALEKMFKDFFDIEEVDRRLQLLK